MPSPQTTTVFAGLAIAVLMLGQTTLAHAQQNITTASTANPTSDLDVSDAALRALPTPELVEVANVLLKLKHNADSLRATRLLLTREPNNQPALINAGKLSITEGQAKEAAQYAARVLKSDSNNPDALLIQCEAAWRLGNTALAIQSLKLVDAEDIERWRSHMPLSVDLKKALPADSQIDDSSKDRFLDEVALAVETRPLSTADTVSANALRRYPKEVRAAALRAEFLMRANRAQEALTLLRRSSASGKWPHGAFPSQDILANALAETGDRKGARAAWKQILANTHYSAEQRTEAQQSLKELDKADFLEAGDKALATKDFATADAIALELETSSPNNNEVRAYRARIFLAQGRAAEAVAILTSLKATAPPGRLFTEQSLLAEGLAAKHDYISSKTAWEAILQSQDSTAEQKVTARDALKDIKDSTSGQLEVQGLSSSLDEGDVFRSEATVKTRKQGRTQWLAGYHRDQINLSSNRFNTPSFRNSREEGYIGAAIDFSDNLTLTTRAGAWNDGALGSILLERNGATSYASLQITGNERALDSLLLESLEGRQNKVLAAIELPLTDTLRFEGALGARTIHARSETIGTGLISEAALRWYPLLAKLNFSLGYHAEISSFNANTDSWNTVNRDISRLDRPADFLSIDDVLPHRINRHGVQVQWTKKWNDDWKSNLFAEGAYRQESTSFEYVFHGSIIRNLSEDLSLSVDTEYNSSGSGPNTGSAVYMTGIGLKYQF
jgi:predicted Zn-dependent protease